MQRRSAGRRAPRRATTVEVGRNAAYGIWLRTPTRERAVGRALLGSLEPRTTYRYRVTARAGGARQHDRHVHDATVPRVDGRRGDRQHAARRRAAVLPAHGLRPVRLGVPAEPRRRREPLHGQRLQHAVGAARRAAGAGGLRDSRGVEGRRRRARHDRLVPPGRGRPLRAPRGAARSTRRGSSRTA